MRPNTLRRWFYRCFPLTGTGWTALAFVISALAIASGVFLRGI